MKNTPAKIRLPLAGRRLARLWLALGAWGLAALATQAQTTVTIDPSASWLGFMTVYQLPADGFGQQFYSPWGTKDLQAGFTNVNQVYLLPCTNVWETTDTYWVQADGVTPNDIMDASFYVENDKLANTNLVFAGNCISNSLTLTPEPLTDFQYYSTAFIKIFDANYYQLGSASVVLSAGQTFSVNLDTTGATHVQYGFETAGPDANPATAPSLGGILVAPISVPTPPFSAAIKTGVAVSWKASAANSYQPQKSPDGVTWTNWGLLSAGNSVTSLFDFAGSSLYRILELTPPSGGNLVADPGFETAAANAVGATNWNVLADTGANIWATNKYAAITAHSGAKFLYIESTTPATGTVTPPSSDVRSDLIPVSAGTAYSLSFYAANPVKVGGANPQYYVFFFNSANAVVGNPIYTSFASAGTTWTLVTNAVTPPTGATQMTIGWIQAMGAGNAWDWVSLIDDVTISSGPPTGGGTNTLTATVQTAVGVTWPSVTGKTYTVQTTPSVSAASWSALGTNVLGTGTNMVTDPATNSVRYYRVLQVN